MDLDRLQNIASISKTFTATALMQLWEQGAFQLDDDVNEVLPFTVRPDAAITFRQLLTHTSSIADGTSYARNYGCGDPDVPLGVWIEEYFTPGGRFYSAEENFHDWAPGEGFTYNNVAFGLLGYLVELMSGEPFADYCRSHIFEPLGNDGDLLVSRRYRPRRSTPLRTRGSKAANLAARPGAASHSEPSAAESERDGFNVNCVYSHPNYPDGFLRTSVRQLALYMSAYLRGGEPILGKETVDTMLSVHAEEIWGLCWYVRDIDGLRFWGHGGADPGVNTRIDLNREKGIGAIVFANTFMDDAAAEMRDINAKLISTIVLKYSQPSDRGTALAERLVSSADLLARAGAGVGGARIIHFALGNDHRSDGFANTAVRPRIALRFFAVAEP